MNLGHFYLCRVTVIEYVVIIQRVHNSFSPFLIVALFIKRLKYKSMCSLYIKLSSSQDGTVKVPMGDAVSHQAVVSAPGIPQVQPIDPTNHFQQRPHH